MSSPLLSIVIPARNDSYMGDSKHRLEMTLECLTESILTTGGIGGNCEVIVSDWASSTPLANVVRLSKHAKKLVKFLYIPPRLTTGVYAEFPIVLIQNAGIRRASGKYVMQTDGDVIIKKEMIVTLRDLIRGDTQRVNPENALFGARRMHLPYEEVRRAQSYKDLIPLTNVEYRVDYDWGFGFCSTGLMMMTKKSWEWLRGYDERLIHWGWMEIDLGLRATMGMPYYDISVNHRQFVYHMEHYPPCETRKTNREENPQIRNKFPCPNDNYWGFGNDTLEMFSYVGD